MVFEDDRDWEIQQLHIAIDYYEREVQDTLYIREAIELSDRIHKLNKRLKDLEKGNGNGRRWRLG